MYFPVWIDECSPPSRQTLWMALFFITEHMGIIIGYSLAFILVSNWYWGFLIQAGTMVLAGVMFMMIPTIYYEKSVFKEAAAAGEEGVTNEINHSKQASN